MKKALQVGGIAAGIVLIGFGIATIVLAAKGGNTVNSNLNQEFISGSPDMARSDTSRSGRGRSSPHRRRRARTGVQPPASARGVRTATEGKPLRRRAGRDDAAA